jgi:hypothetical protein
MSRSEDSPINGYKGLADLRDVHDVRTILLTHIEEQRAHNALVSARLGLAPPPDPTHPVTFLERVRRWMPALPTNRLVLVAFAAATIFSLAGSVAALPVARSFWSLQQVPPHVHESARVER